MGSLGEKVETIASHYVLKEAKSKHEMDDVMEVIWAANYSPYDPIAQLVFPVLGYTPADREASLAEAKQRFWNQHLADASSHWFYVAEVESAKVVGCCQWQTFISSPFAEGKGKGRLEAKWWPEGEYREFCESILTQIYVPRTRWMGKPFLALNWMAVLPTHRRRGIGSLLMNAGITRADALGFECWIEASSMGKPLYEAFGFRTLSIVQFDTKRKGASDLWRKCQHELTPPPFRTMWRPNGGVWAAADGVMLEGPWETDLNVSRDDGMLVHGNT